MNTRRLHEESESPAFSYAQLEALLTGDERIMQLCKMETDLEIKLQLIRAVEQDVDRMKRGPDDQVQGIPYARRVLQMHIDKLRQLAPDFALATTHLEQRLTGEAFLVNIQEHTMTNPLEAAQALAELAAQLIESQRWESWLEIGSFGGFKLCLRATEGQRVSLALCGVALYPIRFTQNSHTFASDRRLQAAYEAILEFKRESEQAIAYQTKRIATLTEQLNVQEGQLIPLQLEAQALALKLRDPQQTLRYIE